MYTRLENKMTKAYFREIVTKALAQAEEEYHLHPDGVFTASFYNQLQDIQKTVIEQNVILTEEQAYTKYPMSLMIIRNFEDDEREYYKQLSDIVWGIFFYPEMPEV
ncbi:hypothetical protein [Fluviicola taffensis]|uniref:hypothetical protein n=1 Tax=Fluviicola taffensis TaxID=191579 RepID=UPI003137D8BB